MCFLKQFFEVQQRSQEVCAIFYKILCAFYAFTFQEWWGEFFSRHLRILLSSPGTHYMQSQSHSSYSQIFTWPQISRPTYSTLTSKGQPGKRKSWWWLWITYLATPFLRDTRRLVRTFVFSHILSAPQALCEQEQERKIPLSVWS